MKKNRKPVRKAKHSRPEDGAPIVSPEPPAGARAFERANPGDGPTAQDVDGASSDDGIAKRDITEHPRAEEALRESEEKFAKAFRTSPYAITITRARDGRFIDINPAFTTISGYAREEALADSSVGLNLWVDLEDRKRVVADLREGREVVGREFRFKKKNGESLTGLFSAQIIHLQNEPCILSSIDDISARKTVESQREAALEEVCRTAEALREKNKELTRFTNAVSHDLRSPLVTVQTFLGHLESDLRDQNQERVVEDFGFIKAAADKMGRLLDELLRLSRVGRMINPAVEMPLQAVVQDALDITAGRIAGRGVRVVVTNEPVVLYGDRARLTEIFQNLVDNAAKFMGGQPAPRIEIGVEESGGELVLYVRDNGIGLDPNFSPRLFGLFEKFDPAWP
jgi:PAS domain S-box-containing protein